MDRPRVLLLAQEIHTIPPIKGAAVEQWIDAVAHRLRRYEAHVISVPHPSRPDRELVEGVHYHRIRIGRLYNRIFRKWTRWDPLSYADRVRAYLRYIEADIVHVHNAPLLLPSLRRGARVLVLHMHNEKEDAIRPEPDALIGCSRYITEWYRGRGVAARRFDTLPNGVDTRKFQPSATRAACVAERARAGVPCDRFVVLYVGRISPEKGPDLLLRAAQRLDPARFHFVLVGEWPRGSPAHSERVRYAHSVRSLLERIPHTVMDSVPPDNMAPMYRLGDLLVIPSRFEEPFSMVAIEGMASGVPVLALRRGGMCEYMMHGDNALMLDADAGEHELAEAIRHAADDPASTARVAAGGRRTVEERFSWEQVVARTEALYDALLEKKQPCTGAGAR